MAIPEPIRAEEKKMEISAKEFGILCQCLWEKYHRPEGIIEISSPNEWGGVKIGWTDSLGKHWLYKTISDLMELVHASPDWVQTASFEDVCRTIPSHYGWEFREVDGLKHGRTGASHLGYEWTVEELVPKKLLFISGVDSARGIIVHGREVPYGALASICS